MSTVFTRRPAMNPSRRLPAGAPIWPDCIPASARPRPPLNNPAEAPATPLRKFLRFSTSSPSLLRVSLAAFLEGELGAEFEQPPAHDLDRVQPPVVLDGVSRVLVEDGARVEGVIDVEIAPQLAPSHREGPADTEIQLLDPIIEERIGRDQIDGDRLIAGGSGLAGACREVPA